MGERRPNVIVNSIMLSSVNCGDWQVGNFIGSHVSHVTIILRRPPTSVNISIAYFLHPCTSATLFIAGVGCASPLSARQSVCLFVCVQGRYLKNPKWRRPGNEVGFRDKHLSGVWGIKSQELKASFRVND